jgi:hypothetical protein
MPSAHKFKRGFKKFADDKAIELRKELGIKPSHPLPGLLLAEHLKAKVLHPKDVPGIDPATLNCLLKGNESEWSGVALHVNSQPIIIINNTQSLARQESTIMHELAHIICEHTMGEFQPLAEGIFLRSFNKEHEGEAEWLGGCLQLPGVALYYNHRDGLTIQEIAEKFNASVDMVRFRMNMCGIEKRRR